MFVTHVAVTVCVNVLTNMSGNSRIVSIVIPVPGSATYNKCVRGVVRGRLLIGL